MKEEDVDQLVRLCWLDVAVCFVLGQGRCDPIDDIFAIPPPYKPMNLIQCWQSKIVGSERDDIFATPP